LSWLLPVPLLLLAGAVAMLSLAILVRRPMSALRLRVEKFITALLVIGAFWLGWLLL
jgi:hypothetical protein